MMMTNPTTSGSGAFVAYAAIESAIDAPATANCVRPNPSNGFTARPRMYSQATNTTAFSFSRMRPAAMMKPDTTRPIALRFWGAGDAVDSIEIAGFRTAERYRYSVGKMR